MSEDRKNMNDNEEIKTEDFTNENVEPSNEYVIETTEVKNEEIENSEETLAVEENENNKPKNKRKIPIKSIIAVVVAGGICLGFGFMQGKNVGRNLPATTRTYDANKVIATVGDTKIPLPYLPGSAKIVWLTCPPAVLSNKQ